MASIAQDTKKTLFELRQEISKFVDERDWHQYHTPKSLSIAISIESAELLEHFLFKPNIEQPTNIEGFTEEMADIFIYLMSLANSMQIENFSEIIRRKLEKNNVKYPKEKFSGKNYMKQ